jgi:hypothetical protein
VAGKGEQGGGEVRAHAGLELPAKYLRFNVDYVRYYI